MINITYINNIEINTNCDVYLENNTFETKYNIEYNCGYYYGNENDISLEWKYNQCNISYISINKYICSCNHLSFHSII